MYFSDSRTVVQQAGFDDTYFADDLTCYKAFAGESHDEAVKEDLEYLSTDLHFRVQQSK